MQIIVAAGMRFTFVMRLRLVYIYVNSLSLSLEAGANCHRVVVKRRRKFSRVPAYVPCVHANCGKGSGVCFWLGI